MPARTSQPAVAIWSASSTPMTLRLSAALARTTGLPIIEDPKDNAALLLTVTPDRLELRESSRAHRPGFAVDFSQLVGRRGGSGVHQGRRQPIARAFGKDVRTIVDATAGWGRDAFLLASLGYAVTAIERSPIVAALLCDGVERARRDGALQKLLGNRLTIVQDDARIALQHIKLQPDAVYLDPMYPPRKKQSARSRKTIELLRLLVGHDEDAGELFERAMQTARKRVVVKRADDAPLLAPRPTVSHAGNTVRYDVYVTANG